MFRFPQFSILFSKKNVSSLKTLYLMFSAHFLTTSAELELLCFGAIKNFEPRSGKVLAAFLHVFSTEGSTFFKHFVFFLSFSVVSLVISIFRDSEVVTSGLFFSTSLMVSKNVVSKTTLQILVVFLRCICYGNPSKRFSVSHHHVFLPVFLFKELWISKKLNNIISLWKFFLPLEPCFSSCWLRKISQCLLFSARISYAKTKCNFEAIFLF